ncbi:MAG: outer membrane lipid asymmetry maintenance protein MlaD [Rickettsiales bacterium]
MANNAIETVMGAVVLTVAGGFLYFAYSNSNVKPIEGYAVNAAFSNISGISTGSDVRVGGIKIGVVENMELDPKTFQAVTTLRIGEQYKLPKDSSAAIHSPGLLGDKFIDIQPGGDEQNLGNGDKITFTQPAVSIEELVGKFVFSGGGIDKGGDKKAPADALAPDAAAATKDSPVSSGLE